MGATRDLAQFVIETRYDDLPPDVVQAAKRCLVNLLAVGLHAAADPSLDILLETFAEEGGRPRATIWGTSRRASLQQAALANGYLAHLDDFDDTHFPTVIHPSAPTIPAAIAMAEGMMETPASAAAPASAVSNDGARPSGRDVLAAVALGIEACCRVGMAVHPWHYDAGWHITGTAGVYGAAAAAGKLRGLDVAQLVTAFGIAGTQAAGVREVFGTMTKPFHAGRAAQSGVLASLLAARGFTAPESILEGRRGFGAVLSAQHDFIRATDGLGTRWEILHNGFKPYACGVVAHPLIDACRALRAEVGLEPETAGIRSSETTGTLEGIVALEARVHPLVLELMDRPEVHTGLDAKFSVQHAAAVALVDGAANPAQFTDAKARDPLLAALRRKVSLVKDEQVAEDEVVARLVLRDGRAVERHVVHATGAPENPMTEAQLSEKFRSLAGRALGRPRVEALLDALWRLDELDGLPDLSGQVKTEG